MKPEQKPFVVEFKNRRRLTRKETSIWGPIDLKAAGDAIAAEQPAGGNRDAHGDTTVGIHDHTHPGRDQRLIAS